MTVTFLNTPCKVVFGQYASGHTAIRLVVEETGEPMGTATINVPGLLHGPDWVVIKNYSENQGIAEALEEAGVIGNYRGTLPLSPYAEAEIYQLLVDPT